MSKKGKWWLYESEYVMNGKKKTFLEQEKKKHCG